MSGLLGQLRGAGIARSCPFFNLQGPSCRLERPHKPGRRLVAVKAYTEDAGTVGASGICRLGLLRAALEKAVQSEDYAAAAKLRDELRARDPAAAAAGAIERVKAEMERAIGEERYQDAAWLRDCLLQLQLLGHRALAARMLEPPPPQMERPPITTTSSDEDDADAGSVRFACPPNTSDMVTNGIRVTVTSSYLPEQSCPEGQQYLFSFTVRIANEGQDTVRLKNRYWLVTDAEMDTQEVRGHGLSGWRPILAPGEWISYRASCLLRTPAGSMEGHLEMWTRSTGSVGGEGAWEYPFRAEIGQFGLNSGLAQGAEPSRPEV